MEEKRRVELEQLIARKYDTLGGIIVQKGGKTVYEYYMNDCTALSPVHVFSVTKSVMSILIGIAIDQGYIRSVDQKVLEFFPDYTIKKREKTIQEVTLRDMLTMTVPYKYKFAPYTKYFSSGDWVKAALDSLGGKGRIGEFRYTPLIGPDIFSGIIRNATGKSVLEFAREYLFDSLDIQVKDGVLFRNKEEQMAFYKDRHAEGWVSDPKGVHTGGWGLILRPADMLKIGELYLNNGVWNGRQIVSEEWIRESTRVQSRWGERKYGYLWWIIDEEEGSYAALGDGGNAIYVNPKKELVAVVASYFKPRAEEPMRLIKEYIEPYI